MLRAARIRLICPRLEKAANVRIYKDDPSYEDGAGVPVNAHRRGVLPLYFGRQVFDIHAKDLLVRGFKTCL